jgi:hypothetical protein
MCAYFPTHTAIFKQKLFGVALATIGCIGAFFVVNSKKLPHYFTDVADRAAL